MSRGFRGIIVIFGILVSFHTLGAPRPFLAFSDLVSGPSQGLNDGKGVGTIVSIWGQNLEAAQGKVFLTGHDEIKREASYIYYWKPANGKLPGGPSDLFSSHRMYEIAFSIPKSPDGISKITVETSSGETSTPLPFTVRPGNIYHVKPSGDNATGNGSFSSPWEFVNGYLSSMPAPGNEGLKAGDILYSHGVREPSFAGGGRDVGMFLRGLNGTLDRQIAITAYPNTQPIVESPRWGVHPYLTTGIVLSKYIIKGGLLDDPMDTSPTFGAGSTIDSTMQVKTSQNGRIIANRITDSEGKCSNGWHGAISSGELGGSNVKIFGNYIYDLGCRQTSHFHHTTYMSKRDTSDSQPSIAWEYGWNHLEGNKAKYGIHSYDQSPFDSRNCGDVIGTLRIHNNYIKDQRGSGINLSTNDYDHKGFCWGANIVISKNILINTGLGPVSELTNGTAPYGISVGGDLGGNLEIINNLISDVSDESARKYATASAVHLFFKNTNNEIEISKNIILASDDITLIHKENKNHSIFSNIFYSPSREIISIRDEITDLGSTVDNNFYDPKIAISPEGITVGIPAIADSTLRPSLPALPAPKNSQVDFYGNVLTAQDIGPFHESSSRPNPPSSIEAK